MVDVYTPRFRRSAVFVFDEWFSRYSLLIGIHFFIIVTCSRESMPPPAPSRPWTNAEKAGDSPWSAS